jgi:nuclear pore complex protein Nup88
LCRYAPYDDDGRGGGLFGGGGGGGGGEGSEAWSGPTVAARPMRLEGTAAALRGPLPLGTDPVEGDDVGGGGGGGMLGRGVVARVLAAAPFAAGEGGGALLAVAHQRTSSAPASKSADEAAVGLWILNL